MVDRILLERGSGGEERELMTGCKVFVIVCWERKRWVW